MVKRKFEFGLSNGFCTMGGAISGEKKELSCQVTRNMGKLPVIIHQRRGYLGEWANADKIDLLVLLLKFRIVRRKVKLLEIDALGRSDGVDEHLTSDTLP
jgi:hypothetical protein